MVRKSAGDLSPDIPENGADKTRAETCSGCLMA
jgi:hypothetical protein